MFTTRIRTTAAVLAAMFAIAVVAAPAALALPASSGPGQTGTPPTADPGGVTEAKNDGRFRAGMEAIFRAVRACENKKAELDTLDEMINEAAQKGDEAKVEILSEGYNQTLAEYKAMGCMI